MVFHVCYTLNENITNYKEHEEQKGVHINLSGLAGAWPRNNVVAGAMRVWWTGGMVADDFWLFFGILISFTLLPEVWHVNAGVSWTLDRWIPVQWILQKDSKGT